MTRTEQAICQAAHALFGVSREALGKALSAPGATSLADQLVSAGLSMKQADQALEAAFTSVREEGDRLSSRDPNRTNGRGNGSDPGEQDDDAQPHAAGLRNLIQRLDDVLAGRVRLAMRIGSPAAAGAPRFSAASPRSSEPITPPSMRPGPASVSRRMGRTAVTELADSLDRPPSLSDSKQATLAELLGPPPIPPEGMDEANEQHWLTDEAVARWALGGKGIGPAALGTARVEASKGLPLAEALVLIGSLDLVEAVDLLSEEVGFKCAECGAHYQLGVALVPYADRLPCPHCAQELNLALEGDLAPRGGETLSTNAGALGGESDATMVVPGALDDVTNPTLPRDAAKPASTKKKHPAPADATNPTLEAGGDPLGSSATGFDKTGRTKIRTSKSRAGTLGTAAGKSGTFGTARSVMSRSFSGTVMRPDTAGRPDTVGPATDLGGGLSKYEIIKELARGGMGIVYKARQRGLGRIVCLKVMRSAELASDNDRRRFLREAEASARLNHPGIVPIHDVGEHQGKCFFSMEFIEGKELGHHVRDTDPGIRDVVEIMVLVCDAIHYAHQRGIIHRDLKPANVMVDLAHKPHVMDFGIAKRLDTTGEEGDQGPMTQEGEIMGTPHYMAPEQAEGRVSEIDIRTDVYALGVICYELFTGKRPFQDDNILNLIRKVVTQEPTSLRVLREDLDPDLETIVLKAMEKEKTRRYQTAQELKNELERWLHGDPIQARRATVWYRWRKWAARNRGMAISIAVFVSFSALVLGIAVTAQVGKYLKQEQEVATAVAEAQAELADGNARHAFLLFGDVLYLRPDLGAAREGRVEAALRLARAAIDDEQNPGAAEAVLQQVESLGVSAGKVDSELRRAGELRREMRQGSVERRERAVKATRETLQVVARLSEREVLQDEQGYVFDLVRHQDPETIKILREVVAKEGGSPQARRIAAQALGWMRAAKAVPELVAVVKDEAKKLPVALRIAAADALSRIGGEQARDAVLEARRDSGPAFRSGSRRAVRRLAKTLAKSASGGKGVASVFAEADRLRQVGKLKEAALAYDKALKLAPAVQGFASRAEVRMGLGRLKEAEQDLDRVVKAEGSSLRLGLLNRAEVRRRRKNLKGALDDLNRLLKIDASKADAYLARARIYLAQDRVQPALADLGQAISHQANYGDALATRAEAYLALGKLEEAFADALLAVRADPGRAEFLLVRARVMLARKEYAAAEEDAARATSLRPTLSVAYRLTAQARRARGDLAGAVRALKRGASRATDPHLTLELVRLLLVSKQPQPARDAVKPLVKHRDPALRREALLYSGVAAVKLKDYAAAVADLTQLVKLAPRWEAGHYNLACARAQAGQIGPALDALERAIGLGHSTEALDKDADLAPLRGQARFKRLVGSQ